jgi:hypothetical protein
MNKRLGTYLGEGIWNGMMADALSDYFLKHEKELKDKWIEVWVSDPFFSDAPTGNLNGETLRKVVGQFKEFRINDYTQETSEGIEKVIDRDIVVKHYNYVKGGRGHVEGESLRYITLNDIYSITLLKRQIPVGLVENVDKMYGRVSYKPLEEAKNWGEEWLKKEIESLEMTLEQRKESLRKITKGSD